MTTTKLLVSGLLMVAGGVSGAYLLSATGNGHSAPAPPPVVEPSGNDRASVVQGIGYVEPATEVRGLSFKGGGVVAKCAVEVGSRVKAGDLVMALNDAEEEREKEVAEAELELAKAEQALVLRGANPFSIRVAERALDVAVERLTHSGRQLSREVRLLQQQAVAESEYEDKETAHEQAKAEKRRAEAELGHLRNLALAEEKEVAKQKVRLASARRDQAAQRLADMRLTAPIDGAILEILRREGEAVSIVNHEPVALFGDLTRLRVRAEIDERYVHRLKPGQAATIYGHSLGAARYRGRLTLVKEIMGQKTVFLRSSTERRDLDVVQVFVQMDSAFRAPAGLRVDVAIDVDGADAAGTNER